MKIGIRLSLLSALIATALTASPLGELGARRPPNILVILADDLGIGDVGCYGNDTIRTPNIDRLAAEGVKLTHHLAAAPMCTPSRAAMMTSRYPARYGLVPNERLETVVIPHISSRVALPLDEVTLATALRAANYTTALVGKWHLGMYCNLFGESCPGPLKHGFDTFYGIPVTLFMEFRGPHPFWVFDLEKPGFQRLAFTWLLSVVSLAFAKKKLKWSLFTLVFLLLLTHAILFVFWFFTAHVGLDKGSLWGVSNWLHRAANSRIFRQDKVVESPIELDGLSQRLAAESRKVLADFAKDDKPFFLFHSLAHVHTPMFNAPNRERASKHGRYGDNIEEMDESIGTVLDSLKEFGLEDNTLVYFTSDQGGHLEAIDDDGQRIGGHNGLFKGGKAQGGPEGGIRVAGIYRWPGHLPGGAVVDTPTSLMDLMPTFLDLAGLPPLGELVPSAANKDLDGQSIADLLMNGDRSPPQERIMIHHCRQAIRALRLVRGDHIYKMHLAKVKWFEGSTQCGWGHTTGCFCYGDKFHLDISHAPELYDLAVDPYEDKPIDPETKEYKEIVDFLRMYLKNWQGSVHYPDPPMSNMADVMWRPHHQPMCWHC
ncbi:arylsulfatase H-like isoform X1 [Macrobrachium nipponense]|uniref:arylsulfatase H-like isoform X1 n=1 Tax=Macrobrachium nipponense TaxID=159736 RepID=UPI0030C81EF4